MHLNLSMAFLSFKFESLIHQGFALVEATLGRAFANRP